jgi:hypothetical protein
MYGAEDDNWKASWEVVVSMLAYLIVTRSKLANNALVILIFSLVANEYNYISYTHPGSTEHNIWASLRVSARLILVQQKFVLNSEMWVELHYENELLY